MLRLTDRAEIFPTQAVCDRQVLTDSKLILCKKCEAVVVGSALRAPGFRRSGGRIAEQVLLQHIHCVRDGRSFRGRKNALEGRSRRARRELDESALEIVVERAYPRAPVFPSEFPRVLAANPREVVEDLIVLAHARSRNAEYGRSEVL